MARFVTLVVGIGLLAAVSACHRDATEQEADRIGSNEGVGSLAPAAVATAMLRPTEGSDARGSVSFASTADGVRVTVDVVGLDPGEHALRVRESADCANLEPDSARDGDGTSSVEADASGRARQEFVDTRIALEGQTSIVGRTVVLEEQEAGDDMEGDADANVACGVIVAGQP